MPPDGDAEFTTARLRMRRWRDADLPVLRAVYGDADAMRWVGDGQPLTAAQCARWLEVTRANYASRGYGMFAIERTVDGDVVGFIGLVHPGGQAEPEAKYALLRTCWGQGLATEALAGLLRHGWQAHGLRHVVATAAAENLASHRVLLKAGMLRGALRDNADGSRTQLFHWHAADAAGAR
jgi:RimJ/RimL family protein N-acetyltransferase